MMIEHAIALCLISMAGLGLGALMLEVADYINERRIADAKRHLQRLYSFIQHAK